MEASVGWFISIAALTALAWAAGVQLGRGPGWRCRLSLIVGLILLGAWAWLIHNPAVAVRAIPLQILSRIEGTAAVPVFMLVVGVALGRSRLARQKRLAVWAAILGGIYFLQGGGWMLQATPQVGLAQTVQRGAVRQSQDYSCVPAASATALNLLGLYTTEAEMAQLTQTRPGTGATMIRAMNGISLRLQSTPYKVELIQPTYEQLRAVSLPAITPLQFERTRRHMVTILFVGEHYVRIADPVEGTMNLPRAEFENVYCNQVLIFLTRKR